MTDVPRTPIILFRKPTIVSGDPDEVPYVADVLVSDGLIQQIGKPDLEDKNAKVIDAAGFILCPGFIDLHAHSDLYLLSHPDHEPKVSQGCTTEVIGQDGISYSPIRSTAELQAIRDQIAGWNGNPSEEELNGHLKGIGMFEWRTMGEYLDCLERNKTATNVATLVPQGNLRLLACGPCDTVATPEEIVDQIKLLRDSMDQGAIGMSSGLTYTPGMYASNSELAALCSVLAKEYKGAYYAPHHRSYGFRALESYGEMLTLATITGCPVHLTHATLNFPVNKGKSGILIDMIDQTRAAGADITLDTYPYLPGCTTLASMLPSWASSGGPSETLKRLDDASTCEKIAFAVEVTGCDGGHGIPTNWEVVQLGEIHTPQFKSYEGQTVAEVARSTGKLPIEVFFEVLRAEKLATTVILHNGNEENVRHIMCHETHCSGSDAILHGQTLHPRAYGCFPRFIGQYARELGLMPIADMISHLTSRPAKRMGIYPHRGLVAVGSAADLVLFDPKTIKDKSTHENPRQTAVGIRNVLVNGVVAMDEGKLTGARAGKTLRRKKNGVVS